MALGDFLARLGGRGEEQSAELERESYPGPPTAADLRAALERTEGLVDGGAVPSPVVARVRRITAVVRDTIPRLEVIGTGSDRGYSVMATATDYLPEAVGGYLRLPRRFADTRPVDGGKTSLMVLVDQLDLLGATMDQVFDAVCRDDANALVVHGRFLAEKFGHASSGGQLEVNLEGAVPPPQELPGSADSAEALPAPAFGDGDADDTAPAADPAAIEPLAPPAGSAR
ncbi:hypothetical protein [Gephyromycinifex aptenodytis]|uniref:hypothetical protein n=1 Tax=Gephyromycinifex aptenodytis TaxID=2716227 RepID=UPI001B2FEF73|nr:hypothetical protein [Gephyromycinifex aptenodytis]